MTRALLQQALDALESCVSDELPSREAVFEGLERARNAIDALRAELAKPEQAIHPDNCIWRRNGHEACTTAQPALEPCTYLSTQATNCAGCGKHKHTPLRIDAMGGYVCLTCIDQKLGSLLGEFGYPEPAAQPMQEPATPESLADKAMRCEKSLVEYILQDDIHNRLTPRVVDIAYSVFMHALQGKNRDDGGQCDWFNDTKPLVMEWLAKIRKDLAEEKATAQPAQEPLTREQVRGLLKSAGYDTAPVQGRADFINGLRHGEQAHGIGGKA